jgi:tRNA(adenine34) deaminase
MSSSADDERWMLRALSLAESAAAMDEVPVGAVVIRDDQLLGESGNRVVQRQDPCGHAEVLALRAAARKVRTHRLDGATLYVTLEPCLMCCGALLSARVQRLVFGAREPRTGAVGSAFESLMPAARQQHRVAIDEGLCADQSRALLTRFFQTKR